MNAFWMVLAYSGVGLGAGLVAFYLSKELFGGIGKSSNDIEVERLKVNAPDAIYPWHDAPKWAECAATDEDGEAFWYLDSIVLLEDVGIWFVASYNYKSAIIKGFTLPTHINWEGSKEMRP